MLTPSRHRLLLHSATVTAAVLGLSAPAAAPVHADPCKGQGRTINCGIGDGGKIDNPGGGGEDDGPTEPPPVALDPGELQPGGDPGGPAAPRSPVDMAQEARTTAVLPVPGVRTAPANKTYVRLGTRLWATGFRNVPTEPITAGAQTVEAVAAPKYVIWDLGETTMTCPGPADEGDAIECRYTYKRASARAPGGRYDITATIVWGVTWTCEGTPCNPASGTLDDLTSTSPALAFEVSEIQTNTRP